MQTRMKWTLVIAVAVFSAACGDSMSSLNPTAPSALSPAASNVVANADDLEAGSMGNGPKPGNGNANGNGNGNQPRPPAPSSSETPSLGKVELEGLVDAVGSGWITVSNQKLVVNGNTVIRHGSLVVGLLDLKRGDRVHVRANRVPPTADGLTLEAVEILFQEAADDVEPPPAPKALVSVSAVDADASENGSAPGVFRLARSGDASSSLTVLFSVMGSATNGVDYETLPTSVMFPQDHATVDVTVTPKTDSLVEGTELATLTVMAGAGYELGSPVSATVNIADYVVPAGPVVTVFATEPVASEDMSLFGAFELRRTGNLTLPLVVTVSLGGTADASDYQGFGTTVEFVANSATATVAVIANPDDGDGEETVILTVALGAGYTPGAPASATVTIPR